MLHLPTQRQSTCLQARFKRHTQHSQVDKSNCKMLGTVNICPLLLVRGVSQCIPVAYSDPTHSPIMLHSAPALRPRLPVLLMEMNMAEAAHISSVLLWLVQVAWKAVATSAVVFDRASVTWPCMAVMQLLQTWQAVGSHLPRVSHDTTPVLDKQEHTRVVLAMLQKVPGLVQSAVALQLPAGALPEMSATALPPNTPSTVHMSKA